MTRLAFRKGLKHLGFSRKEIRWYLRRNRTGTAREITAFWLQIISGGSAPEDRALDMEPLDGVHLTYDDGKWVMEKDE